MLGAMKNLLFELLRIFRTRETNYYFSNRVLFIILLNGTRNNLGFRRIEDNFGKIR